MRFKKGSSKWLLSFMGVAAIGLLALGGCTKESGDAGDVTNPNPPVLTPTGSIQGVVLDRVTLEPIVNAKVTIDLASGVTDSTGSYVIRDVPATEGSNEYTVQVDLRAAKNEADVGETAPDVNMANETLTPRYPDIVYSSVAVLFTWQADDGENTTDDASGAGSGNDFPVDGLVANLDIEVGKLSCNIKGVVYGCLLTADFATPVAAGFDVKLVAGSTFEDNSATGAAGNVVGLTSTDANGVFEFNNIECGGVGFTIVAADDLSNPTQDNSLSVMGPAGDGETLTLGLEFASNTDIPKDTTLHVCINDDLGPQIIAVSPEPGSDLAANTAETVTITFHEPVAQNAFTNTTVSGVDNLYDVIEVNFDGPKAGNVAYSLAWLPTGCTDDCTQLQVTFETGSSSLYHVRLVNASVLTDAAGNPAGLGVCPDDGVVPGTWMLPGGADPANDGIDNDGDVLIDEAGEAEDCTVFFSTTGGSVPAAPTLALVNSTSLDEATGQIGIYDWASASGAKDYVMYCRAVQFWGTSSQVGPYVRAQNILVELIPAPGGNDDGICDPGETCVTTDGMQTSGSAATVDFDVFIGGAASTGGDGVGFVENSEIELKFDCYVAGLSSDGVEGTASNVVRAEDSVGPLLQEIGNDLVCGTGVDPGTAGGICADGTNLNQIVLEFNEELNETTAETAGNYAISGLAAGTAPTVTAVYDAPTDSVTLTLSAVLSPLNLLATRITTGANGVLNTTALGDDDVATWIPDVGPPGVVGQGRPGGVATTPCVLDNGPATPVAIGDAAATTDGVREIQASGDGDCDTTAVVGDGDVQVQPVAVRPAGTCVVEGATDATELGDDVDTTVGPGGGFVHVGPDGVCQTTAVVEAGSSQAIPLNQGIANATAISTGGNGLLDTETLAGDDVREGGKVTVSAVTDVGGNTIRTTGDEYFSDGSVR